jgi:gluconate 5-dehydrogenase
MQKQNPFSLEGETALITGGGSGIGLGIASCFVQSGARVILTGRNEGKLAAAAAGLGESATWEVHDVSRPEENTNLVNRIRERCGPPSILVNNAGNHLKKTAVDTTEEEFNEVIQTHVVGAFSLASAFLPDMIAAQHGSILFIASMASLFGIPMLTAYSAAKSAHLGLVYTLAVENSQFGVRINAIAPGWIETAMVKKAMSGDPERARKVLSRTPMNRFGSAEEIGWTATFLCSPAASYITGAILPVDGGTSIGF